MARLYANTDSTEPISDSDGEIKANLGMYHVIQGCAYTGDVADMTVDTAVGAIAHNYTYVGIAAASNAWTLSSDGTNPRWSWICWNSAGTATLVSGDAAATPSVPELGDNVPVALVYIPAAATLTTSCTFIDKRIPLPGFLVRAKAAETQVANADTVMSDDDTLFFPIGASEKWVGWFDLWVTGNVAADFKYQLTGPATPTSVLYGTEKAFPQPTVIGTSNPLSTAPATAFSSAIAVTWGSDSNITMTIFFTIANGANAGTIMLQWAQNTSNASDTKIKIGSTLWAKRIA